MSIFISSLALAIGAFSLSVLCVAFSRRWASGKMIDIPNSRSSHTQPTPRGGGIGIVIVVLAGTWITRYARIIDLPLSKIIIFSLCGGMVAVVGWLDDRHKLAYSLRLVVQAIVALIVLIWMAHLRKVTVPFIGDVDTYAIGFPLSFLWIVGLTNAYNFMDGIDGIAGGQAAVAGLGWTILSLMSGQSFVGVTGLLLGVSSLGFLLYNWPPARIFMGDVGSAYIGFVLAVIAIMADQEDPRFLVSGFLLVWPFVLDTSFTLLRRLAKREDIFSAHRSHIYQRLVIAGYSHRFVTLVYIGLSVVGTVIAILWQNKTPFADIFVVILPILLFAGLWRFTVRAESLHRPVP